MPIHLLLPLLASMLFVCGLILIKRTSVAGVCPWTITLLANLWAAIVFSSLWLLGGTAQPWMMMWQPAAIAALYVLGQVFTFSAIERGDVSLATPVFGIKVVLVPLLLTVSGGGTLSSTVWQAAGLAVVGIGLVQWSGGKSPHQREPTTIFVTIVLAVSAAGSFALFDVLVQRWSPSWGPGRLLPMIYWIVAIISLIFLPAFQPSRLADKRVRVPLLGGTLLIALQALCIVYTLSAFGDAARVNVVYASRGIWGVTLAWAVAAKWGGPEARHPLRVMLARLCGAIILTVSVVMVIWAG